MVLKKLSDASNVYCFTFKGFVNVMHSSFVPISTWLVATPTCVSFIPNICGALIRSPCSELALVPLCGAECVFDVDYPYFFEPPFSLICGPPNERDVLSLGPSFDIPILGHAAVGKNQPSSRKLNTDMCFN